MNEILQTVIPVVAVGCFLILPAAVVARHEVELHPVPQRPAKPEDIDTWGGGAA
ncbi:hypothetical protein ACIOHS_26750 [Streptomyces sp. NPDC088253]|uniref:hypothetical protein n=1 Tax=Streptomyces sp. NPDC088253 TaxID=3365846 RepID=UPI00382F172A